VLNESKGQSSQLLLFSIIIVGFGVGMLSYAQMSAVPGILGNTLDDVPMVVKAQTHSDNTAEHYIPLSAHYSVAQGAWEESQNEEDIQSHGGFDDHYENTMNDVRDESQNYFDNYISGNQEIPVRSCTIQVPEKEVDISLDSSLIEVDNVNTYEPFVRTICRNGLNEVLNENNIDGIETNTSNIRLHKLLLITLNGTKAAYDKAEQIESNDNHWGEVTGESTCMDTEEDAEDAAKADALQKVADAIFSIQDDVKGAYNDEILSMDETDGEKSLLGQIIDFFNPWSPEDDGFSWTPSIESNNTYDERIDTTTSQCQCTGTWSCNPDATNFYADANSDNDAAQCVNYYEDNNAECDPDFTRNGGSCDYSGYTPTPTCPTGYSRDGNACLDNDADNDSTTDPTCSGYDGYSFSYTGSGWECEFSGTAPDPECSQTNVEHDGSGGCQISIDRPDAECSDWSYDAETEHYYELQSIEFQSDVDDTKYEIPTDDGWENLEIIRTFDYFFSEGDRP